ncbi:MAG: ribonuclease III [Deltaproteobacteria bacterium]|nr:ribonuclease III [Deltaproteobacteria bacterium]
MRVIRPGKLGVVPNNADRAQRVKKESVQRPREIWDDFGARKKTKKKVEYEKGDGERMIMKAPRRPSLFDPARDENAEQEEMVYLPVDVLPLEEKLSYQFKDNTLAIRALTHTSALGAREKIDYERLEFLGDAVLDLSVAHLLCEKYAEAKEGELSKMRAAIVNTQALAQVARTLEVGPLIRLGRGEASSGGQDRPSILADVVEAMIGAIYQDGGYEAAFHTVTHVFGQALDQVQPSDPKTELQELLHAAGSEPPTYLLELVEGPEHAPTFVTVVMVDGEIVGRGRGTTKKAAQQAAAAEALLRLNPPAVAVTLAEGQRFIIGDLLLTSPLVQPLVPTALAGAAAETETAEIESVDIETLDLSTIADGAHENE